MPLLLPRRHVAIAIDGGGIKGLIVAKALAALEKELTGDQPLITYPGLKILTGTSTGALITAGIAAGMRAADIVQLYINSGAKAFPPLLPLWLPRGVRLFLTAIMGQIGRAHV